MRTRNRGDSRNHILRDLWLEHGCPEKMTIHVRRTGETVKLLNGLAVITDNAKNNHLLMRSSKAQKCDLGAGQPVTLTCVCKACIDEFPAQRKNAQFCSAKCRVRFNRKQEAQRRRMEHERLLAAS
jgi:hypothetical protein